MTHALSLFPPTRAAALKRLQNFAPKAGEKYGEGRNFYATAGEFGTVSGLSPYLRCGVISQSEVLCAVLDCHSAKDADRFITEVFWRSYWQGWLAMRPGVWESYQSDLNRLSRAVRTQSALRQDLEAACLGQTGIAPFDDWAAELARSGYLHNHARMWFASIWIHTLKLPWQLGADFFLRHLLDGCPASNTLGWKWVAGTQTIGKPYLASEKNIEKFTDAAYHSVPGFADVPAITHAPEHPDRQPLWPVSAPDPRLRTALILHEDDLNPDHALCAHPDVIAHVSLIGTDKQTPWQMAPHVGAFRMGALADIQQRLVEQIGTGGPLITDALTLARWARDSSIQQLITADAPIGVTKTLLDTHDALPVALPLVRVRRPLNAHAWPLATAGFFKFRKHIPDLLAALT
jgi:deoxyribodipyrimidine photo-lyase